MGKRRDLEQHRQSLSEIGEIMNAMKNLALMETHKLARLLATQRRATGSIEAAIADFLSFHPDLLREGDAMREVHLLIGSERGFCGDFNEAVLDALPPATATERGPALIVIGGKAAARLGHDPRIAARLEGPNALEQVEAVLLKLMEVLDRWQAAQAPPRALQLAIFHHGAEGAGVTVTRLDPLTHWAPGPARPGYAPRLNLDPQVFFAKAAEHYLYAALHGVFYQSLMAENEQRMRHMDFATQRISESLSALARARNSLRQEEITEEIEVIMLNVETPRRADRM